MLQELQSNTEGHGFIGPPCTRIYILIYNVCAMCVEVVVVVVVLYSPNTNRYITDTCKTNNSIKHIWQVAREALALRSWPPIVNN